MWLFRAFLAVMLLANAGCLWFPGDDELSPEPDTSPEPGMDVSLEPGMDVSPEPPDLTPPTITLTDPIDGAAGVEPGLTITVYFDEPIASTAPESALRLLDERGEVVPGEVWLDGAVLRFVPLDDLALLGAYTAVVSPAVTDVAGNPLAAEHRFQLAVRDGAWEDEGTLLELDDTGSAQSPDAAMDARGNVIAVWSQHGPPFSIWAARHDAGTGQWQAARLIEQDDAGAATLPRIAMDDAGNALAVWQQSDGVHAQVWASRYHGCIDTWETPLRLDVSQTGEAEAPRVAMNAPGAAMVVWRQRQGTVVEVWSRRLDRGGAWGAAQPVPLSGQPARTLGSSLDVGIDGYGNSLIAFLDHTFHVQAVHHLAQHGWAGAEELSFGPIDSVHAALDPAGRGFVAWQNAQPARVNAWRYDPAGGSSTALLMLLREGEFGSLTFHDVVASAGGDGIAIWVQESPSPRQIWAGVYSVARQSWSAPIPLYPGDALGSIVRAVQAVMDARGHAHAAWVAREGANDWLSIVRRRASGEVEAPVQFVDIDDARLAANAQGKAVAVRSRVVGARRDIDAILFR
jgi:Bacterial Ig-like domain